MKILKASPYYLEDVLGYNLNKRDLSFLLLNQPPSCDQHCKRCFMPDYRRNYDPKKALTINDYKKILTDASKNGILCLEISGEGEPLLSNNLLPIIEYANKNKLITTLITNGNALTEEQIKFSEKNNVTLVFSLHTLDKNKYEKDNKLPESFERKINNIKIASNIYKNTKTIEKNYEIYRIAIHATLQRDNLDEIGTLRKFCSENNLFFSIAPLALTGNALRHEEIQIEKNIEEVIYQGDNSIIHSHSSKEILGREVCGTAFYGLNIGWDGVILLDAHYGYEIGELNLLGNIKEIAFKEAIKNQKQYMRKLFNNIDGSCPVRDPKGKTFLKKVLDNKISLL